MLHHTNRKCVDIRYITDISRLKHEIQQKEQVHTTVDITSLINVGNVVAGMT